MIKPKSIFIRDIQPLTGSTEMVRKICSTIS